MNPVAPVTRTRFTRGSPDRAGRAPRSHSHRPRALGTGVVRRRSSFRRSSSRLRGGDPVRALIRDCARELDGRPMVDRSSQARVEVSERVVGERGEVNIRGETLELSRGHVTLAPQRVDRRELRAKVATFVEERVEPDYVVPRPRDERSHDRAQATMATGDESTHEQSAEHSSRLRRRRAGQPRSRARSAGGNPSTRAKSPIESSPTSLP